MEFNQKSIKTLFGLVAFGVLLFWALQNLSLLGSICGTVFSLILPFLLGGCIAFILNVPMRKIESLLFRKSGKIADKI